MLAAERILLSPTTSRVASQVPSGDMDGAGGASSLLTMNLKPRPARVERPESAVHG